MTWQGGGKKRYFLSSVDLESRISFSPQIVPLELSVKTCLEAKEGSCWTGTKECEKGKEEWEIFLLKQNYLSLSEIGTENCCCYILSVLLKINSTLTDKVDHLYHI